MGPLPPWERNILGILVAHHLPGILLNHNLPETLNLPGNLLKKRLRLVPQLVGQIVEKATDHLHSESAKTNLPASPGPTLVTWQAVNKISQGYSNNTHEVILFEPVRSAATARDLAWHHEILA